MNLNDLCAGKGDPRKIAQAIADHRVTWALDGCNVLRMARDAQRYDVLEAVLDLDVRFALALLRDLPNEDFVALHRAYLSRHNVQNAPREVGTLFPLRMWVDEGRILEHPYIWISGIERSSIAVRAFMPTPNNPARWVFDANDIGDFGRLYPPIARAAEQAALTLVRDDPQALQPETLAAIEWLSGKWGPYVPLPLRTTTGDVVHELSDHVVLVHLHSGGWTVHLDTRNERAAHGVVTVVPRRAPPLEIPAKRVLGPFSFTPF